MFISILRFILGLIAAVLVAGTVQVMFVAGLDDPMSGGRLESLGMLVLLAATQTAVFATPFALLAAVIAAWLPLRSRLYFTIAGFLIGIGGFFALHVAESGSETILNRYALAAYAVSGLAGGLMYGLIAVPKQPNTSS